MKEVLFRCFFTLTIYAKSRSVDLLFYDICGDVIEYLILSVWHTSSIAVGDDVLGVPLARCIDAHLIHRGTVPLPLFATQGKASWDLAVMSRHTTVPCLTLSIGIFS